MRKAGIPPFWSRGGHALLGSCGHESVGHCRGAKGNFLVSECSKIDK